MFFALYITRYFPSSAPSSDEIVGASAGGLGEHLGGSLGEDFGGNLCGGFSRSGGLAPFIIVLALNSVYT